MDDKNIHKLIEINYSEIVDEIVICPYCGDEYGEKIGCCGEAMTHAEKAYVMADGECYSSHDIYVVNDRTMEQQLNETLHKHYWRSIQSYYQHELRLKGDLWALSLQKES